VSFENETRVIHLANTLTYAELLELVKNKFPNAWPFQVKFLDRCVSPFYVPSHLAVCRLAVSLASLNTGMVKEYN
jgi:hypothetical protein